MTEIAQLFESALQQNRASLLRKAALNTVARMPASMTLRELLQSEAGASIRELTLRELREALTGIAATLRPQGSRPSPSANTSDADPGESREARVYRQILEAVAHGPMTIGQLAKQIEVDIVELRGYLNWMKRNGKIGSNGRARATRYFPISA